MSDSAHDVLAAVLAATEAAWTACERGETDVTAIHDVLVARRQLLARLDASMTLDARDRELATRLRDLDQRLLAWCEAQQRELESNLANVPRRSAEEPASERRLLSDFA
ncbi:MAG TPA: hypothetical protein VG755_06905 [Nannocystaceae bacterium]|nr:hypothetical protein [Nannocystaceae bacterium]